VSGLPGFFGFHRSKPKADPVIAPGVGVSPVLGGVTVAYPINTVAPVITGSLAQGSTLTCSTGTWSNTPSSYSYQWYEGGIAVGTNANTYVSTLLAASIYCNVTATNALGSASAAAAAVGPVTGAGLATPTLSNFSALGASPLVLQGSTTDYVAGLRGQLQIATDSGFVTITQNWIFFIDGASWASNSVSTGLVTPAGQYWSRWRVVRDNENGTTVTGNDPLNNPLSFGADVSAWSTTFTDMISVSVAVLTSANGTSKNSLLTVSGSPVLNFAGTAGNGAFASDRATIEAQSDFTQWEMTITQVGGSDAAYMGFCNLTDSFVSAIGPGSSSSNGVIVKLFPNNVFINWNSDANGATLSSVVGVTALNDIFALVLKKSTNQVSVYRTRSGVTTQIGTTQTIPSFAAYYAFVSAKQGWNGTCNFGASAFARAFGSTETYYG
jgi:hypothetical protein